MQRESPQIRNKGHLPPPLGWTYFTGELSRMSLKSDPNCIPREAEKTGILAPLPSPRQGGEPWGWSSSLELFFGTCQPRKGARGDSGEEESGSRYRKGGQSSLRTLGDWFQDPPWTPRSEDAQVPYIWGSASKGSTNHRWIRGLLNQRMRNLKIWRSDWIWGAGGGQALQREGKVSGYVNWKKCTT